jgi:alpha-L-fucosidase
MTMGTAWPWTPHDNFKSVGTLVHNLCTIVARGGSYLIGIGPDSNGEFDQVVFDRLRGLGAWMKTNGEAIYGSRSLAPYESGNCVFSQKRNGDKYAIVLADGEDGELPDSVALPHELVEGGHRLSLVGFGPLKEPVGDVVQIPEEYRTRSAGGHAWAIKLSPNVRTR